MMKINCPYCNAENYEDTFELGCTGDGDDIQVVCRDCNRTFFARFNVEVYLDQPRMCPCLDDISLCEMEKKRVDLSFMDNPPVVYRKCCKNCGRDMK